MATIDVTTSRNPTAVSYAQDDFNDGTMTTRKTFNYSSGVLTSVTQVTL